MLGNNPVATDKDGKPLQVHTKPANEPAVTKVAIVQEKEVINTTQGAGSKTSEQIAADVKKKLDADAKGHESVAEVPVPPPGTPQPLDAKKVDNALKNLAKLEQELLGYSGKPGVNPHLFINETIKPLREAIKKGPYNRDLRNPDSEEISARRIGLFNDAVGHALQLNFESTNIQVPVYVHPALEGSKLVGTDGTKTTVMPVE